MSNLDFLIDDSDIQPKSEKFWNVLIVDDEPDVHHVTKLALSNIRYDDGKLNFYSAYSAAEAKQLCMQNDNFAVAIIDVVMETEHAGLDLVHWVRNEASIKNTRIILRTGQPGQAPERDVIMNYDINDYREKSELTSQKLFSCLVSGLRSYASLATINDLAEDINRSRMAAIKSMAMLCESRDAMLGNHIQRVADMSYAISQALIGQYPECDKGFCELIRLAATLHDAGKISIPDEILNAPRKLNENEFQTMMGHCKIGASIIHSALEISGSDPVLDMAHKIAFFHHEQWSGEGYPQSVAGTDIPLEARIVAIADVYDALRARRCYKDSIGAEEARSIIRSESGKHFEPALVDAFLSVVDKTEAGFRYDA